MEFFGLATGFSKEGPLFPTLPESILKSYPVSLLRHPALPDVSMEELLAASGDTLPPATLVLGLPVPNLLKSMTEGTSSFLDKSIIRYIGLGVAASAVVYGAWRIGRRWVRTSSEKSTENQSHFLHPSKRASCNISANESPGKGKSENAVTEMQFSEKNSLLTASEPESIVTFQQHLTDSMARLTDVRCRLEQLENQRELFLAEIAVRKEMVMKLQGENNEEREKRQQAELKMEMMQIENSQLHKLRKEIAFKQSQIDRLEYKLRQKEEIHIQLLKEGVVAAKDDPIDKTAKELETLQTRLQRLESTLTPQKELFRENGDSCQLSTSSKPSSIRGKCESRYAFHINTVQNPNEANKRSGSRSPILQIHESPRAATLNASKKANDTARSQTSPQSMKNERRSRNTFHRKRCQGRLSDIQFDPSTIRESVLNNNSEYTHNRTCTADEISKSYSETITSQSEGQALVKNSSNGVLANIKAFFHGFNEESVPAKHRDEKYNSQLEIIVDNQTDRKSGTYDDRTQTNKQNPQDLCLLSDDNVFISASCGSLSSCEVSQEVESSKTICTKSNIYDRKSVSKRRRRNKQSTRRDGKTKKEKENKKEKIQNCQVSDGSANTSDNNNERSAFIKRSPQAARRLSYEQAATNRTPNQVPPSLDDNNSIKNATQKLVTSEVQKESHSRDSSESESEHSWIVITPSMN